ncbi:hypothetical protein TNCV_1993241 [Trichonephila clavipes]|nr:hypothetical protein TNCV_1993241 [Trichonephila clavipes]
MYRLYPSTHPKILWGLFILRHIDNRWPQATKPLDPICEPETPTEILSLKEDPPPLQDSGERVRFETLKRTVVFASSFTNNIFCSIEIINSMNNFYLNANIVFNSCGRK